MENTYTVEYKLWQQQPFFAHFHDKFIAEMFFLCIQSAIDLSWVKLKDENDSLINYSDGNGVE